MLLLITSFYCTSLSPPFIYLFPRCGPHTAVAPTRSSPSCGRADAQSPGNVAGRNAAPPVAARSRRAFRAPPPGHGPSPRRERARGKASRARHRAGAPRQPLTWGCTVEKENILPAGSAAAAGVSSASQPSRRSPPAVAAGGEEAPRLCSGKCPPRGRADRAEPPRKRRQQRKELPGRRRRCAAQPRPRGGGGRREWAQPGPRVLGRGAAGAPLSAGGGATARGSCPCSLSSPPGAVRNAGR